MEIFFLFFEMESLLSYICENAHHAHWIIFFLLLLAGFNLPISEDILLLGGGAIASACIPDHALRLYIWILLGSLLSAWEAYWIGRLLGPHLFQIRLFKSVVTPHRLEMLRYYYAKFGIFTFIVGRFCPGGIRNALFMSSGLTKMPFYLFILRDGFSCLISTFTLFYMGYQLGQNFDLVVLYIQRYTFWFLGILLCLITAGSLYWWYRRH